MNFDMKKFIILPILFLCSFIESQEIGEKNMGLIMPTKEYIDSLPLVEFIPKGFKSIPKKKILLGFPIPGNQGVDASCTAWTIGYGLKTYHERIEQGNPNLVMSPYFVYNQLIPITSPCNKGIKFKIALDFLKENGISTLKKFNQKNCKTQPNLFVINEAKKFKIEDYYLIYSILKPKLGNYFDVKAEIAQGNPVVVGILLDNSFRNDNYGNRAEDRFVWDNPKIDCSKNECYHAMLCVGYDDSISAFKFLNSHGTDFGNDGYVWISYKAFMERVYEAYVVLDAKNSEDYYNFAFNKSSNKIFKNSKLDSIFDGTIKAGGTTIIDNNIKVGAAYIKNRNDEAVFKMYDTNNNTNKLIGTYKMNSGDIYKINYNNMVYEIELDTVKRVGLFMKQTAFLSINAKKEK